MRKVGNYTIGRELGRGAFAVVHYAQDEEGHEVAIKVLSRKQIQQQQLTEQVKREINIMKEINHPNVVRLIEVLRGETRLYLVCEYADGGELFDYIVENQRLSEDESRKFFNQIIDAVAYCHDAGIVHRDIKSENTLLTGDRQQIKLTDFGLSNQNTIATENDNFFTVCGSTNYTSPEVLENSPGGYDGKKADIWSIGCLLYVMLAGFMPFESDNSNVLFKKIKTAQYDKLDHISPAAHALIDNILVCDPLLRLSLSEIKECTWLK